MGKNVARCTRCGSKDVNFTGYSKVLNTEPSVETSPQFECVECGFKGFLK